MNLLGNRIAKSGKGLLVFFPALFLFVLPYAHVTALRSLGFLGLLAAGTYVVVQHGLRALPLKAPLAFWLAAALASLFWTINWEYSVESLRGDVLYGIVVFYAFFHLTRSKADLRRWQLVTASSMALIAILAMVSYARHGVWVHGYHHHVGEYATFVVTAIPLLLIALFPSMSQSWPFRLLAAGAMVLGLAGSALAQSRAVWLSVAAMVAASAFLYGFRHPRLRRSLLIGTLVMCTAAAAIAWHVSAQRGIDVAEPLDRGIVYEFAFKRIAEHPLRGIGFGREIDHPSYRREFPESTLRHPHNLLLSYAEQMGVWGVFAALWIFGAMTAAFWRLFRSSINDVSAVGICGLALLVGMVIKNTLDMFFTGHLLLLFWAHAGAMLGFARSRKEAVARAS